jgi:glucosamine-6-phosphate deaminase
VIRDDSDGASQYIAKYIIKRIKDFEPTSGRPFVLGLPTGSSPEKVYNYLVKAFNAGEISFKDVVTFNMVRPIARKLKSASFLTNEG